MALTGLHFGARQPHVHEDHLLASWEQSQLDTGWTLLSQGMTLAAFKSQLN